MALARAAFLRHYSAQLPPIPLTAARTMRRILTAALLLAAAATGAAAQHRTLEPGDRVRVVAPTLHRGPLRGEVVRYVADSLAVRESGGDSVYVLPLAQIRALARNEGMQRGRSVRSGLRVGAFLGAAVGLIAGPFMAKQGEEDAFVRNTALSGAAGTLAGAGLGALAGSLFAGDHWQRFRMPPPPAP